MGDRIAVHAAADCACVRSDCAVVRVQVRPRSRIRASAASLPAGARYLVVCFYRRPWKQRGRWYASRLRRVLYAASV